MCLVCILLDYYVGFVIVVFVVYDLVLVVFVNWVGFFVGCFGLG